METYYNISLYERSLNRVNQLRMRQRPIRYLSPTIENVSVENGLHVIKLLARGAPWNPTNNSGYLQWYC